MSASECPAVSVVVPVYNVEQYLVECLDSLLAQTMEDWEAICIDDGSQDSSGAILDEYAARDSRFRVVHKENGGVSQARNLAISMARAPFLCMVDSDDWIDPAMIETLYGAMLRDEVDMVVCGLWEHDEDSGAVLERPPLRHGKTDEGVQPVNASMIESMSRYSWDKMLKTSIVREAGLAYAEDIPFSEDHLFIQLYLLYCRKVSVLSRSLYHYRRRHSSATLRFVRGEAPAHYYECAVFALLRVLDELPEGMPGKERRMWCTALFAQNFHQIYLVKHVLKGKNHPESARINRAVRRAFWVLFRKTPKTAVFRIMWCDAVRLLCRICGRG